MSHLKDLEFGDATVCEQCHPRPLARRRAQARGVGAQLISNQRWTPFDGWELVYLKRLLVSFAAVVVFVQQNRRRYR